MNEGEGAPKARSGGQGWGAPKARSGGQNAQGWGAPEPLGALGWAG
jgi:hypothetical protein